MKGGNGVEGMSGGVERGRGREEELEREWSRGSRGDRSVFLHQYLISTLGLC